MLIAGTIPSTVCLVPQGKRSEVRSGTWNLYAALYGAPPIMDIVWSVISGAFAKVPGARIVEGDARDKTPSWATYQALLGGGLPAGPAAVRGSDAGALSKMFAAPLEGTLVEQLERTTADVMARHHLPLEADIHPLGEIRYQVLLPSAEGDREKSAAAAREPYAALTAGGFHLIGPPCGLRGLTASTDAQHGVPELLARLRKALV